MNDRRAVREYEKAKAAAGAETVAEDIKTVAGNPLFASVAQIK